jgi:DNA-binding transcriptional MerR regulator
MKQLSIGTVARETGLAVSAIRYYEERGLLPPAMRQSNNRRSYGREDVEALNFIAACRKNGMALDSIRSLREKLCQPGSPCVGATRILDQAVAELTQQIASLQAARRRLAMVASTCGPGGCGADGSSCNIPVNITAGSSSIA